MHLWVCVCAVPLYVFCGPQRCLTVRSLEPTGGCLHWGLGPGTWRGPLGGEQNWPMKKNQHRLDRGQFGDSYTAAWSLQLLAGAGAARNH